MVRAGDTHSSAKSLINLEGMLGQLLMMKEYEEECEAGDFNCVGGNEYMGPWNNYPCEMQDTEPFINRYNWGSQPWQYPRQVQQGGFHGHVPYQQPQGDPPTFEASMESMMQQYLDGQRKGLGELDEKLDSMYNALNTKIKSINIHMRKVDIRVAHNAEAVRRSRGILPNPSAYINEISSEEYPVVRRRSLMEEVLELEEMEEEEEEEEESSDEEETADYSLESADGRTVDRPTLSVGRHIVPEAGNPESPQTTPPGRVCKLIPSYSQQSHESPTSIVEEQPLAIDVISERDEELEQAREAVDELERLLYDDHHVVLEVDGEKFQDQEEQSTDTAQQSADPCPVDRQWLSVDRLRPHAFPKTTSPQQQPL